MEHQTLGAVVFKISKCRPWQSQTQTLTRSAVPLIGRASSRPPRQFHDKTS